MPHNGSKWGVLNCLSIHRGNSGIANIKRRVNSSSEKRCRSGAIPAFRSRGFRFWILKYSRKIFSTLLNNGNKNAIWCEVQLTTSAFCEGYSCLSKQLGQHIHPCVLSFSHSLIPALIQLPFNKCLWVTSKWMCLGAPQLRTSHQKSACVFSDVWWEPSWHWLWVA